MKNTMKFLMILVVSVTLFSCGGSSSSSDDSSKSPKERLIGEWKIVKAEGSMASLNEGTKYIFESETNLTMKLGIIKTKCTYTATDSSYTYQVEGMNSDFNNSYYFEGEQLIVKPGGSDQTFYLEKQ